MWTKASIVIGLLATIIIALMAGNVNAGEPYIRLHQAQLDQHFEGQLDSEMDHYTECWSCKQTSDESLTSPLGMAIGSRIFLQGDWFLDGSLFLNESAELSGEVPGVTTHVETMSYGATMMLGHKLPGGFSVAGGMAAVCLDGKLHSWLADGREVHERLQACSGSLAGSLEWTHRKTGAFISATWIATTGTMDDFGHNPLLMLGGGLRF